MGNTAFGNEVIDSAFAVGVTRVPVLHRGVFYFCIIQSNQFYNGSMQLIFITHGRGAPFQVTNVAAFVGNNKCALKLACITFVNPKIGGEFHGTAHAFRNVNKGAITKYSAVHGCIKIIFLRYNATKVFFYQLRVFFYRFGYGTKNYARFFQFFPESGCNRHGIEHGINRNAREHFLFVQGNTQFFISLQ